MLTERNIKKATLSFLKNYYKYRPRLGETEASIDMRGEGGIIADGYLTFPNENGNNFTSTFEATSYDTRGEVKYKVQKRKLIWDGLAIASVATATGFTWHYTRDTSALNIENYWLWIYAIVASIVLWYFLYLVLFRKRKRYRYIYAVEQFKKYHVNEQWISIAEDVFPHSNDKYFTELKNQCIYNGFGLIKVDKEKQPQLMITPAREEIFDNKRKAIQFKTLNEVTGRLKGVPYSRWLGKMNPMSQKIGMLRFRGRQHVQMTFFVVALIWMTGIFLFELNKKEVVYVNEKTYPEEILNKMQGARPEAEYYLLDTLHILPYNPSAKTYIDVLSTTTVESSQLIREIRNREGDILISTIGGNDFIVYDCERFYNIRTPKFIISEGTYQTLESATERMDYLMDMGLEVTCLWMGCFDNSSAEFVIYLNLIQNSLSEADEELKSIESVYKELRLNLDLGITVINPKQ